MKHSVLLLVGSILAAFILATEGAEARQSAFSVDQKKFISTGSNPYFNLPPGYRLIYKNGNDADTTTVLSVTKRIDGVETRAVEDRETKNGQLVELTLDYYAVDPATQDVYYFGEDVDVYKGGKVVSHEGAWRGDGPRGNPGRE